MENMRLVYIVKDTFGCSFPEAMIYSKRMIENWDKISDAVNKETEQTVWLDKK